MKHSFIAIFMLRSHGQLARGDERDSALRVIESGIRLHRLGYPTSSSRLPDFERSATRLEREGYPTWTSRLPDIVRRKRGYEDRIRGMRRMVNGAVSFLHQLPQQ